MLQFYRWKKTLKLKFKKKTLKRKKIETKHL